MSSYTDRDALLATMGYRSYDAYLASDLWKSIRERAVRRDKRCVVCGGGIECVHHESYSSDVLRGANIRPLKSLCHDCHKVVEFRSIGDKRSMEEANVILHRLLTGERELNHKAKPVVAAKSTAAAKIKPKRKPSQRKCKTCDGRRMHGKKVCVECFDKLPSKRPPVNWCVVCKTNRAKAGESFCGMCRREKPMLIQLAVRK